MSTEKLPRSWEEELDEAYANEDISQRSLEDIQDDEDFIQEFRKILGMTVYRNRGYDIVEAEVRKRYAKQGIKIKSIPTIQHKKFMFNNSFHKIKLPDSDRTLEQEENIKSFRKWLMLADSKNITSTQVKSSEDENNDKGNNQIKSSEITLTQVEPSQDKSNDKENKSIKPNFWEKMTI